MPLVAAKCTQCGAEVQVDNNLEAARCEHCGTAYIVEDAISNYNVNVHADNITVQNEGSLENRLKAGCTRLSMGDYGVAYAIFEELAGACPYDCRGWIGLAKVGLWNQKNHYHLNNYEGLDLFKEHVEKARISAERNNQLHIFNQHKSNLDKMETEAEIIKKLDEELKGMEKELKETAGGGGLGELFFMGGGILGLFVSIRIGDFSDSVVRNLLAIIAGGIVFFALCFLGAFISDWYDKASGLPQKVESLQATIEAHEKEIEERWEVIRKIIVDTEF